MWGCCMGPWWRRVVVVVVLKQVCRKQGKATASFEVYFKAMTRGRVATVMLRHSGVGQVIPHI